MVNQPFADFFHPDDVAIATKEIEKLIAGAVMIGFECRYRCKDASYRLIAWNCVPDVKTGLLYACGRDITNQRIRELETKQIFEAVNRSAITAKTDLHGTITEVNDQFCKISGYSQAELIGKDHRILNSGHHSKDFFSYMWSTISKGDVWTGDIKNKAKDGSFYWVRTVITPVKDYQDKITSYFAVRFDITAERKDELKLATSEERMRTIFGEAPLGIALIDSFTGRIYEVNERFAEIAGRTIEEMVTIDWMSITHPDDVQEDLDNMALLNAGKISGFNMQKRFIHSNGSFVWISMTIAKFSVVEKNPRHLCMVEDITKRKLLESAVQHSHQLLQNLSKQIPGSIYQYQSYPDGRSFFPFASEGIREIFEVDPEAVKTDASAAFAALHKDDFDMIVDSIQESARTLLPWAPEFRVNLPLNGVRWLSGLARPERLGDGSTLWHGYIVDITKRKQLEQKVADRTQLLQASYTLLENLSNNTPGMIYQFRLYPDGHASFPYASAGIVNVFELTPADLNSTQSQYMETVYRSALSLLDLLNDILDFSKIEAGKMDLHIEKVDLFELSNEIIDTIKYKAHEKGLDILINIPKSIPRYIWTDSVRLRQIMVNLLGNAIKFTQVGEIEYKIECPENEKNNGNKTLLFSVRDTGIGISEPNQSKIFEAFEQEDASTTRRYGGTGLGLAISNKILSLMGTKLQLKSDSNTGSIFSFQIHLKCEFASQEKLNLTPSLKKILIVDDNLKQLAIFKEMVSYLPIQVTLASSGEEALNIFERTRDIDLVLIDYEMPNMNGLEVVRNIRTNMGLTEEQQPVIILECSSSDENLDLECQKLGVQLKILKPLKLKQVYRCLSKVSGFTNPHLEKRGNPRTPGDDQNDRSLRILVVEDNAVNMMLTKALLKKSFPKSEILEAVNGIKAVEKCQIDMPDLILMDIQMPEMNGYEATASIRTLKDGGKIPIIALTAGTLKGEEVRCLEAGMNDYLSKPIVLNTLRKTIIKWIETK